MPAAGKHKLTTWSGTAQCLLWLPFVLAHMYRILLHDSTDRPVAMSTSKLCQGCCVNTVKPGCRRCVCLEGAREEVSPLSGHCCTCNKLQAAVCLWKATCIVCVCLSMLCSTCINIIWAAAAHALR